MKRLNGWLKDTANSVLSWSSDFLHFVDQKVGIELFKLGVVLSTVYFVQGMGGGSIDTGLTKIPLLFYFKDVLHYSATDLQYFKSISAIAWLMKPLFGFISDRWPIFGYRRKSYMIMMALTASMAWFVLAAMASSGYSHYMALLIMFNLSSLGYAFVDVVCDGLMVQRGQELNADMVAQGKNPDKLKNLVNLQWFAIGVSGFIASMSGGYLQNAIKAGLVSLSSVFVMAGIVPLLTAVVAWTFVKEEKILRRTKKPVSRVQGAENKEDGASVFKELLTSRTFWMLTAFLFFWHFSPSFSAIWDYYSVDILKFDAGFMGILGGIGNAIFPFSIILYFGLLRWFPNVRSKTYLYVSIAIGLVFSAFGYMYYMPPEYIEWIKFSLPGGSNTLLWWCLPLSVLVAVFWLMFKRAKKTDVIPEKNITARLLFVCLWILIIPLSVLLALRFSGASFAPFQLSYRSLAVLTGVLYGYLSIAAFLIPLSLAGELAPSKAEAMTYAYFMALINLSKGFIPDVSGAKMFEVLEEMLLNPLAVVAQTPWFSFGVCFLAALASVAVAIGSYKICRKLDSRRKIVAFIVALSLVEIIGMYFSGMVVLGHIKTTATYAVQHSFIALKPIIGSADYLGENAYRALILRYAVIIGAIFTVIAAFFVYILPINKKSGEKEKTD